MEKHLEHLRFIHYLIIGVTTIALSFGLSMERESQLEYTIDELRELKTISDSAVGYWDYLAGEWPSQTSSSWVIKKIKGKYRQTGVRFVYHTAVNDTFDIRIDTTFDFPYEIFNTIPASELVKELNRSRWFSLFEWDSIQNLLQREILNIQKRANWPVEIRNTYGKFNLMGSHYEVVSENEEQLRPHVEVFIQEEYHNIKVPFLLKGIAPVQNWAAWSKTHLKTKHLQPDTSVAPFFQPRYPIVWATIADLPIDQAIANLEGRKTKGENNVTFIGIPVSSKMLGFFIPLLLFSLLGYFFTNTRRTFQLSHKHEAALVPYFGIYPGLLPTLFTWATLVVLPLLAMLLVMFRFDHFLSDVFVAITQTVCLISSVYFGLQAIGDLRELKKGPVNQKQDQPQPSGQQPHNRRRRRPQRPRSDKPSA